MAGIKNLHKTLSACIP